MLKKSKKKIFNIKNFSSFLIKKILNPFQTDRSFAKAYKLTEEYHNLTPLQHAMDELEKNRVYIHFPQREKLR